MEDLSGGFTSGVDQINRPRVVPLRRVGSSCRPTPLGEFVFGSIIYCIFWYVVLFTDLVLLPYLVLATPIMERADVLRNRQKRRLIRAYRSGRKKGMVLFYFISFMVGCPCGFYASIIVITNLLVDAI